MNCATCFWMVLGAFLFLKIGFAGALAVLFAISVGLWLVYLVTSWISNRMFTLPKKGN
jgi:hypothetical protein